ncbi:MAG TPA: hypothetical protein PK765_01530 [bacterium]|nr:hypothetical protein [bacterium]
MFNLTSLLSYMDALRSSTADLIRASQTVADDGSRDYWLNLIPTLSEDHLIRLRDILLNEKHMLEQIESEYQKELAKANREQLIAWEEFNKVSA